MTLPMPNTNGTASKHSACEETIEKRPPYWIPIYEEVAWTPTQRLRVISIGAGFSGLTMANKIQNKYKLDSIIEHVIYEKNCDIGGTWLENRYPGVMCDVPAHMYTLLDLPNPEWPSFYATGAEIQAYLHRITRVHSLDRDIRLNSRVTEAIWEERSGTWKVQVQQGEKVLEDWCHVLLNGSGVLNGWSWPKIQGLDQFQGHLCHSADWKNDYDFSGKRVAVIGNGSSGIQIVPQLQKTAAKVLNYARSPTWISAPYLEDLKGPEPNPKYSEEQKNFYRENPGGLREYRKKMTHEFNKFYEALIEGSIPNQKARERAHTSMIEALQNSPDLIDKLVPTWSLGCRRITPGNGYLAALSEKNVELMTTPIEKITATGIVTSDGRFEQLDAIVCATGFDVSFRPRWRQLGRDGRDLAREWDEHATSYFSLCVSGQPNYFMYNGPASPVAHGSLPSAIDWEAEYMIKWITKMAREDIKSFEPRAEVQEAWNTWGDELLKRTVWNSGCSSWYKRSGRISALYPGSILHFKDCIENIRGEDFDVRYRSRNRWRFLGNGFTELERQGGDLAYYLEH
ncbi:uncharacterized protein Z520_07220 [Fonsecaea multimorphosa CBS 102226]|uniref:FAD/NAD(P)-binding domain-containing protein n=1 Tax=Fonsecaea multimorphosa CBS 102226 TaxID=1442371 RepID=A0A0D2IJ72_9EURO|nr:uncharacterized protein Z520_07220 [Fonsecaea multimorphosa CBS 102226]KIX97106.1 hypothetical protein Z520_07220 [Fonsecaea multimorphosa CBS 102226]OAL22881.1 hypothetical protein AYO22_06789 [Fonsecaea multimorphosa]